MKTLGVDLASQPANTGLAIIAWTEGLARLERLELGATDERIVAVAAEVDVVGIDAPFGWPAPFIELLDRSPEPAAWTHEHRDRLRFRRTDFAVRGALGRWPLSVSSDLIALPAMRCQGLLRRLNVQDRSGDGRVVEVYPALALHRWGFPSSGYKGSKRTAPRAALWERLETRVPWLSVSAEHRDLIRRSDDALDAVVAAIVARAAQLGALEPIPAVDRDAARVEGWIAIPTAGSLAALGAPGA
jgi:predicted nuclease with RNAse H fold